MNSKLFLYTFIISGMLSASCQNYLDTVPEDKVTPESFLTGAEQANTLLNGVYNQLYYDSPDKMVPYVYDNMSDNSFNSHSWDPAPQFASGTQTGDSDFTLVKWKYNFRGISRANSLLKGLAGADAIANSDKAKISAEARFLRAYYYFDLVCFYGEVPILDEQTVLNNPERGKLDAVLSFINKDLDYAIDQLPVALGGERASKGTALMLKLRVAEWMNKPELVISLAQQIQKLGYQLYPNYFELFQPAGIEQKDNPEIIFKINYAKDLQSSDVSKIFGNWNNFAPTLQMVDSYYTTNGYPIRDIRTADGAFIAGDPSYNKDRPFDNRDPRLQLSIVVPGSEFRLDGQGWYQAHYVPANWDVATSFTVRKFVDPYLKTLTNETTDRIVMRYAEVLLAWAEAENQLHGPSAQVYELLDRVRSRVGMVKVSQAMPNISQAVMTEVIHNERRVEFFGEGRRWFDIRRWKIAKAVMVDALGYDKSKLSWYSDGNITTNWQYIPIVVDRRSFNPNRDYLWPIPNEELNANPNIKQNSGY
ncbi:SusD family protein [compost metagenome]